ncbi:NADH dehydrogenase [ubiquinone] 1 subunit C2 [Nylanderia fulva]|uniref:NADH dehydrogenase [ubiquinone] 1 subunit C2 n=1 Tax=Nylanderia fulva TaxID=613905 RepID=UPI0010FB619B|nr:NADH dehydrogenase [ubiquinone] 1 subunit C2 [Nylanderia fulva]
MSQHHSHEIEDHPEVKWALELLKPDPNYKLSVMQEYAPEVVCVGSGFTTQCLYNYFQRRPFYAGIYRHIIAMAVGYVASQAFKKYNDDYKALRDTRLRDYIIRHPELFPEPTRVKYGDLLLEWCPIR